MANVVWADVTLRDGELTPGVRFSIEQKLEIARSLIAAGITIVEVGFPGKFERDRVALPALASALPDTRLAALCRATREDIEVALRALAACQRPRLHLFAGGMPRQDPALIDEAAEAVLFARKRCDDVQFSPLDATRLDPGFLRSLVSAVVSAGAATVNLSDTLGVATPASVKALFQKLIAATDPAVVWSFHGHNDLGLATANTLSALESGAGQIEACVNGLGPRAGNTALEEVAANWDRLQAGAAAEVRASTPDLERLRETSRLVELYSGIAVPETKPLFGAWATRATLAALD